MVYPLTQIFLAKRYNITPCPKSYHSSLWWSTLKEASFSVLKGDLYHTLSPCCITDSCSNPAKKSISLIFFTSCIFMAYHFHEFGAKNRLISETLKTMSSKLVR